VAAAAIAPAHLRTEWLLNPEGLDTAAPRFSWRVESPQRGARQTAYQILVADSAAALRSDHGNLWDSGRVSSDETLNIEYGGHALVSGQAGWWKVRSWDASGRASRWSAPARFSLGLLRSEDWRGQWISFRDAAPLPTKVTSLVLPPARHYRREFVVGGKIVRATLYFSALGLVEMHLNGQRVGEAYFESGWADYHRRAYYRAHDVTSLVGRGTNCLGAIVADGWYAGYVGYGLLVGYGPNKSGRNIYGKSPALLAQLELRFADGTRQLVATGPDWQVTDTGPIREADLIMGEAYDARAELPGWARAGFAASGWERAIRAEDNGSVRAPFYEPGVREVREFGFRRPPVLQAYAAPPIRVTQELKTQRMTEPHPGVYLFDFGQNFAGVVRLKVKAPPGTRIQLRYGEMLHPEGRLMTENLRRARATDFYTCRGTGTEVWSPRFTYHGFQYVEVTGLPARPAPDTLTGLVLHNDTPLGGEFACSDPVMTKFARNARWTQRANFVELPTDCPQRDERLGWMGDAQVYARTATYYADVAAFFTKWLDDVREAQRASGAYPDYCPYPFAHGSPGATHGTAWTDAGVIVPYTVWLVYGDTRLVAKQWDSLQRFMAWRAAADPALAGVASGNAWGDWLNVNENTPIAYLDLCYHAYSAKLMAELAGPTALHRPADAALYRDRYETLRRHWASQYLRPDGQLAIDTQTAYVLALAFELADAAARPDLAARLTEKLARNGQRMATGFLGTKSLLPVLSANGGHELALRLFLSREFPSWGYEVEQGANSVWERWDSYTREHGFNGANGNQNAAMNSFSHYSFGAVMQWAFQDLAGIDTDGPGYKRVILRPRLPAPGRPSEASPLGWVTAQYDSARGMIHSSWRRRGSAFEFDFALPANTTATAWVPAPSPEALREGGRPLARAPGVRVLRQEGDCVVLALESGTYRFWSRPNRL
jgi:alpha-L-rhamnosidase